jgi:hypothetical protein
MWENLLGFFSGSTTPWIIGIISAAVTGWWALKKIRYEKRLEKFKETNESLFKEKKQEVLAAIATLSIFKRDPEFEKNTIDVLLSRLYTELDYDIINSILTTLIQDSNRSELLYIADGLQDINRNFFIQENPMNQRIIDLNAAIQKIEKTETEYIRDQQNYKELLGKKEVEPEVFLRNKNVLLQKYNEEFHEVFALQKYKLVWHKQVTADAYAIFMRKAYLTNRSGDLQMRLFQNDFNWAYVAEVNTTNTCIERSAFGYSLFVKVTMQNIIALDTSFVKSKFFQSRFVGGTMTEVDFSNVVFHDTVFEKIHFERCKFKVADFYSVKFINCKGLTQEDFESALRFSDECVFPENIVIEHNDDYNKRMEEKKNIPLTAALEQ